MPAHKNFRFPPIKRGNGTLALRPLLIPEMHEPVQDGDNGINIKVATGDPKGLWCAINPYLPQMSEGDRLDIWWNNKHVLTRFVTADEVDQRVFFYLPTPTESGWAENCHYVLTRVGETEPDPPSASLRILIKLFKPGNRDKEPHLPDGHSELNIVQLPPEVVEQGVIDAGWAEKGVKATIPHYVYCTRNDKVRLHVGDHLLAAHLITQEQAENRQPIEILIKRADILRAGDGVRREIRYDINDEVWNWADRHSKRTYVDIEAGGWYLEYPVIRESINGVITIRDLNKQPVTVQIHVSSPDFSLGDKVEMTFIGRPPGNAEPIFWCESREINNVPSVLEIKVPYDLIRSIVLGRADASYILYKKDGGDPLSSKRTIATVVGDVNMLPEPNILELIGDTLKPDLLFATVEVRYAMKNGDLICLIWLGTRFNGDEYLHEATHIVTDNEAREGLVTFHIEAEHITVLDNGTLDLSYVVANDAPGLDVRESERLLAKVEKVRATLPRPKVEEADPPGDVLDPSKVFDSVHVLIAEAETLDKDVLTYYWRSPNPFSSTSDWLPITTVSAGKPVRFRVDEEYVTANIGQYVDVRYVLWRAASQRYEYSATLVLLIGEIVAPVINSVVDTRGDSIPDEGFTFDTSVTVKGTASSNLTLQLYDGITPITPIVTVDASGEWTLPLTALSVSAHSITAKALYGNNPVSAARTFTVAVATAPTITSVRDSKGEVAAGGTTFDTSVTLSGKAFANQKVEIFDGITSKGQVTVDASGNWTLPLTALSVSAHSITAKALYGNNPVSAARTFTVAVATTPTITSVRDSKGEVAAGGTTFDTSVTLSGKAFANQKIEIFDGQTSKGQANVNASGDWTLPLTALSASAHSITAKALYGNNPVSAARTFTVAVATAPTITSVRDSKGEVAAGGTTFDTSVTLSGKAFANQKVEIFDGQTSKGQANVNASGDWTLPLTALSASAHSITAKALYGNNPVSAARTFTVAVATAPTITSVRDSKGEVAAGGTTFDTSVTLSGKAFANQKIEIFDGQTSKGQANVNASGDWTLPLTALSVSAHSITAKALYGNNPVSAARTFTVAVATAPTITSVRDSKGEVAAGGTTFDTSVTLSGKALANQKVEIFDGITSKGQVTVDASGNWSKVISGLSFTAHPIKARALYGTQPESAVRSFSVEQWTDSVTNFTDGTSGNWSKGSAGYQGGVASGVFQNFTTGASGHSGVLFSQSFRFVAGHTYSFSYRVRNISPQSNNMPPIFSVRFSSGQQILPVYSVPRTAQWYTQAGNFSVSQNANYTIQIISHQDRGGGSGSDGGNDYQIDDIIIRLVR
ncbi:hypothetical protein NF675_07045 [Pseudomonas siliginis]|uniref:hypothetical protein n=1 Tax=Pseudomonas siliginis TaxID=2842346 RepID=UPI002092873E|nr:hypothetical protein [Pseudomonas siliginis]UST75840.1 hypothetical protein NF675_07045 [Pseudomonas siliginis]